MNKKTKALESTEKAVVNTPVEIKKNLNLKKIKQVG
jgi:hypothetical protein